MIRKIILRSVPALLLFLTAAGCKQNDALMYENDPRIYFYRGAFDSQQRDSILQSFFLLPSDQEIDTVFVDVRTMGLPVNVPRTVKFVQTNTGQSGAAVPGKHYVAFDNPDIQQYMVIPSGAVSANIPVVLYRHADMNSAKFRIEMQIVGNDYFQPGIDDNLKFMVQTTAMAEQPSNWQSTWRWAFGTWGPVKMGYIIEKTGFKEFEESYMYDNYDYYFYLKAKLGDLVKKENALNPEYPLCEDVGKHHPGEVACERCVIF